MPSLRGFKQHKTLKVAFRGGLGGGMAEAEAPEQRDMKLRKCIFCRIFVSTNPSYYASCSKTDLDDLLVCWTCFQFCDHTANLDGLRNGSLVVRILYKV